MDSLGDGHGLFGLVHHMAEELTDSSWPMNRVTMLIEIHTIPGFDIDWHKTRPWPFTPTHSMEVSIVHAALPIEYSWDCPYIQLILHGKLLVETVSYRFQDTVNIQ